MRPEPSIEAAATDEDNVERQVQGRNKEPSGLDRLTTAEREALHLLAQGHTAKSIAALTGRSVAGINERLRDARRKTGVSSSRELARLLRAEKGGDEFLGVVDQATGAAGHTSLPSVMRKGVMMAGVLGIAAVAASFYLLQGGSSGAGRADTAVQGDAPERISKGDSLLENMFEGSDTDASRLYVRIRHEARDSAWATGAEAALRTRYDRMAGAAAIKDLRIICASSLCEVAGIIPGGDTASLLSRDTKMPPPPGLRWQGTSATGRRGSFQLSWVTYWHRSPELPSPKT